MAKYRVKIRAFSRGLKGFEIRSATGNKFPIGESGLVYDQGRRKRYTRRKWASAIGFPGGNNWPIKNGNIFEGLRADYGRDAARRAGIDSDLECSVGTLVPIPSLRAQHKVSIGFYPWNDRRGAGARSKRDFRVN